MLLAMLLECYWQPYNVTGNVTGMLLATLQCYWNVTGKLTMLLAMLLECYWQTYNFKINLNRS